MKPDLSDWTERERFYLKFKINMLQNFMINIEQNNINCIIDHNMDFPTNDYFVYSSHNTYLKGHQLYGYNNLMFRRELSRDVCIRYKHGLPMC